MKEGDCSGIDSGYYLCASRSVDMETGGTEVKSYVKSCYTKEMCESGDDLFKSCKQISGAKCELNCCDSDNCNGGTVAAVSVTLMVACALMALFR